jgi:hypothetical protein
VHSGGSNLNGVVALEELGAVAHHNGAIAETRRKQCAFLQTAVRHLSSTATPETLRSLN